MKMRRNSHPTILNYIAGIAVGTLVVKFGENLDDSSKLPKVWITFLAPTITILFSFLLNWISFKIGQLLRRWKYEYIRSRQIKRLEKFLTKDYLNQNDKRRIKDQIIEIEQASYKKIKKIMEEIEL